MRRWLLWNFRCLRGRRCADLRLTEATTTIPGVVMVMEFVCGGCGTCYRREAMLGKDGNLTHMDRRVVRA